MKKCNTCSINKPVTEYTKRAKTRKDGGIMYRGECKKCRCEKTKIHRKNNIEHYRAYDKSDERIAMKKQNYIDNPNQRYDKCRRNAKKRGYEFLLTMEEYEKLTRNQYCYLCNQKFNYTGLDRVNNNRGYEIGNVLPCCRLCNSGKNDDTLFNHWMRCKNTYNNLKHLFL